MSGFRTGYQSRFTFRTIAFVFYAAAFICPAMAADSGSPFPDLSGQWGRDMLFFEPPPSGPGPVINAVRDAGGTVAVLDPCCAVATQGWLGGNHTSPILKPEAAEARSSATWPPSARCRRSCTIRAGLSLLPL